MNDLQLSIGELARAAGVSVRTIRYYIAEGLLPPAEESGPKAAYGRAHLDRLRAIDVMKRAYLPLKEIRRQLAGLDEAAIHELAEQTGSAVEEEAFDVSPMMAPPEAERRPRAVHEDAVSYIANLRRQTQPAPAPRHWQAPPPREPTDLAWRRIPLGDEAELLISDEAYRRRKEQIDGLVEWAKRILS